MRRAPRHRGGITASADRARRNGAAGRLERGGASGIRARRPSVDPRPGPRREIPVGLDLSRLGDDDRGQCQRRRLAMPIGGSYFLGDVRAIGVGTKLPFLLEGKGQELPRHG
jgi:hypothetical protein